MRIVEEVRLRNAVDRDEFAETAYAEITTAIRALTWPPNGPDFAIHPVTDANGVVALRKEFQLRLLARGYQAEWRPPVDVGQAGVGAIDLAKLRTDGGVFAVEWETGNVSSSHRALNKLCLLTMTRRILGGALVVPTRRLAKYLTDRIGNFEELRPYIPLWRAVPAAGLVALIAVEHDRESLDVDRIPKGTDGRALR